MRYSFLISFLFIGLCAIGQSYLYDTDPIKSLSLSNPAFTGHRADIGFVSNLSYYESEDYFVERLSGYSIVESRIPIFTESKIWNLSMSVGLILDSYSDFYNRNKLSLFQASVSNQFQFENFGNLSIGFSYKYIENDSESSGYGHSLASDGNTSFGGYGNSITAPNSYFQTGNALVLGLFYETKKRNLFTGISTNWVTDQNNRTKNHFFSDRIGEEYSRLETVLGYRSKWGRNFHFIPILKTISHIQLFDFYASLTAKLYFKNLVFIAPVVTTISGFGVIVGGRFNSDKMGSLEVSAGINTNKHLNIVERELFAAHLYYYFNANNNEENLNLY